MVLANIWRSNCSFLQHMQETFGACRNAPWSLILLFPPLGRFGGLATQDYSLSPPTEATPTHNPLCESGEGWPRRPKGLDPF